MVSILTKFLKIDYFSNSSQTNTIEELLLSIQMAVSFKLNTPSSISIRMDQLLEFSPKMVSFKSFNHSSKFFQHRCRPRCWKKRNLKAFRANKRIWKTLQNWRSRSLRCFWYRCWCQLLDRYGQTSQLETSLLPSRSNLLRGARQVPLQWEARLYSIRIFKTFRCWNDVRWLR